MSAKKACFLFILSGLSVYMPAFLIEYGIHNDYYRFQYEDFFGFPETVYLIVIGRPLQALLLNTQFYFIDEVPDFAIARFVNFLFMAAFSLIFARYLTTRLKAGLPLSLATAFGFLTLPASQAYIIWANQLSGGILPLIVSAGAYFILDGIGAGYPKGKNIVRIVLAMLVYIASALLYPPNSLALLIFTFARVLFSDFESWPETRGIVIRDVVFAMSGLAVVFFAHRYVFLPALMSFPDAAKTLEGVMKHPIYSLSLSTDFSDKTALFFGLSKVAFSGIWHIVIGGGAAKAVSLFIVAGMSFLLYQKTRGIEKKQRPKALWRAAQMVSFSAMLVLAANSPMLAAKGAAWAQYRMTFVYSAMTTMTVFFLIHKIGKASPNGHSGRLSRAVMVCLLSAFMLIAFRNMLHASLNANKELNFVRKVLSGVEDLSRIKNIVVITTPFGAAFIDKDLRNEFKMNTVNWNPMPPGLLCAILKELGVYSRYTGFSTVRLGEIGSKLEVTRDDSELVIDMNKSREWAPDYSEDVKVIEIKSSIRGSNPSMAFDGLYMLERYYHGTTFWAVSGYPQRVEIKYYEPRAVSGYSIVCRFPAAIPLKWTLEGSLDGKQWAVLDRVEEGRLPKEPTYKVKGVTIPIIWKTMAYHDGELSFLQRESDAPPERVFIKRTAMFDGPVGYKHYRFTFTGGKSGELLINEIEFM